MTYQKLKELLKGKEKGKCYTTKNENGEDVIIAYDDESIEVKTLQSNKWIRVHTYWSDGTIEETYER